MGNNPKIMGNNLEITGNYPKNPKKHEKFENYKNR